MTDIDFYILAAQQPVERLQFACRLAEKAYQSQCKVCVHVDDAGQASELDDLMWSFRTDSFLPHAQNGTDQAAAVPIQLCHGKQHPEKYDVLINLADSIPSHYSRFKRVLEIVIQEDAVLDSTRQHYRFYKDRGYPMNNFDMRLS